MANTRRTRSYRGESKRTSGSGALLDTVRSTITKFTANRGRSGSGGGSLASKAGGLVGGLLGGGGKGNRGRGRRRR